jgi:hypothetical protein
VQGGCALILCTWIRSVCCSWAYSEDATSVVCTVNQLKGPHAVSLWGSVYLHLQHLGGAEFRSPRSAQFLIACRYTVRCVTLQ